VSAEEIKFPPAERRDARRFEAPPWEQKQFEELEERRDAERAAEPREPAPEPAAASAEGAEAVPVAEPAAGRAAQGVEAAEPATQDGAVDAELEAMLAQLAVEEESGAKSVAIVGIASGALLAVIGCVLIIWGVAAFVAIRRAGAVGAFGGAVLLLFGAGFVVGGVWIGTRHLRQRGVH